MFGLHTLGRTLSMNPVEKTIRRIDGFQQRHTGPSFVFGVVKKFGDDSAGTLAALIAYYGFLSIFPLLLVLTTLLGLFFAHDTALQTRIINSAVGQFPIVGKQLSGPHGVRSLRSGSVVGLAVGLIGLVWGSLGVSQAAQRAMAEVWNVPGVIRPGFLPRLGRSVEFLALLALDLGLTTFLAGTVTLGHRPLWFEMLAVLITLAANVAVYVLGFRILTPKSIKTKLADRGGHHRRSGMDDPAVCGHTAGRAYPPACQPDLRLLRERARPGLVPLFGRRAHCLRGGSKRGPEEKALPAEHRTTSADRR